ncbi:MAG: type II toxin-antitoxin system VapC family toxin [Acidobacteriota bacterium]
MIVPDINLLIYPYDTASPHHLPARRWWAQSLTGPQPVGLAWISILGFIRITTRRSSMISPITVADAISTVQSWLALPNVEIIHPTDRHADVLFSLLTELGTAGNLTSDAHLAALAIEYHATLATTDVDFLRFAKLRTANPLKA